jgi:dTDP-4-amino-4,6-dideoxygalactose transaminase
MDPIPFNVPQLAGGEHAYIDEALRSGKISGNGQFARRASRWLEDRLGSPRALITPSCTAALELAAILCEVGPGDEVIVPSFTFVSTVNAFALRGATPVFVDVLPETLNIDPAAIRAAITDRTRVIVVVHYAGVGCEMEEILAIASQHGIRVVEDAAHGLPGSRGGKPLGSIGALSTFSFHETKNVQCGEGGALVVNDPELVARAEIVQEKGTDRAQFFRGQVDKYTWRDIGSSYLLSEVAAAFLWAQLEHADAITDERRAIWSRYHEAFADLEHDGLLRRPQVPDGCEHSGHLYYLLLPEPDLRDAFIAHMAQRDVHVVFHYVPLHSSPAGRRLGRTGGSLAVTDELSARLVRLPIWCSLGERRQEHVIAAARETIAETVHPAAGVRSH